MKVNYKDITHSFVVTCMIRFVIYILSCLIIYWLFNSWSNRILFNAFPSMSDFLEYEQDLIEENFQNIPMKSFPGCKYVVMDYNERIIYTSDKVFGEKIQKENVDIILDWNDDGYYNILEKTDEDGNLRHHVFLVSYDWENDAMVCEAEAVLDEDLNILEGDLFPGREKLSRIEFQMINGVYNGAEIYKYQYRNWQGRWRQVVFAGSSISMDGYDEVVQKTRRIWLLAVPLLLAVTIIQAVWFSHTVRRQFRLLNEAVVAYKSGESYALDWEHTPLEFRAMLQSFYELLESQQSALREKERINSESRRIVANISHDIKTPLTVIYGYARAFAEGAVPEEKKEQYLEAIYRKSKVAVELVNSLFEYSSIEHPEYCPTLECLDLCETCKEIFSEKYNEIEEKHFELELAIPDAPLYVNADRTLIKRLIGNLIGNSLKYNPAGTTIFVAIADEGPRLRLTVADNGVGISKEIAARVFEPFVTGDAARQSNGSTGLGLSVVRRIVELHHGELRLETAPAEPYHTEFSVWLRRAENVLPDNLQQN